MGASRIFCVGVGGHDHDHDEHDGGGDEAHEPDDPDDVGPDPEEHQRAGHDADSHQDQLQMKQPALIRYAQPGDGAPVPLPHFAGGHHGPVGVDVHIQHDQEGHVGQDGNDR